jgi:type IV pilus assembly protein PilF
MNKVRSLLVATLFSTSFLYLAGSLATLTLVGSLAGCAGTGASSTASDNFTDSDEPEGRKRATNRLKLAVLYFQDAKYNYALDEIKQAIQIDPTWFELYGMRGLIYMQTNEFGPAEASFQKALSLRPNSSDQKHNYGVLLCRMKRPAEAIKMFDSALADPAYTQRARTWAEEGRCQLSNGNKAAAEASFMKSLEFDAGNPANTVSLSALLFERGELVRAQFYARRVNNSERATADSLWLGIKIERALNNRDAQSQLEAQLRKRFAQSPEALALDRGAFNE